MLTNERLQRLIATDRDGLVELIELAYEYLFALPRGVDGDMCALFDASDTNKIRYEIEQLRKEARETERIRSELESLELEHETLMNDHITLKAAIKIVQREVG